jgi:hypothetical protein
MGLTILLIIGGEEEEEEEEEEGIRKGYSKGRCIVS